MKLAWRKFLGGHLLLKAVSLVLAVALWLFVVGEERAEVGLSIPLELINLPSHLVITSDVPRDISVRVNGPRRLLRSLQAEGMHHTIDLSGVRADTVYFEISPESLLLPHGVHVVSISPETLSLTLDKIVEKDLQVFPTLAGKPAEGYAVTSVSFVPEAVSVRGPEEVLSSIHAVWTKPINVDMKKETFQVEAVMDIKNPQLSVAAKKPVMAEIKLEEKPITRNFQDFPLEALNAPQQFLLKPDRVDISVSATVSVLQPESAEGNLVAVVDLEGLEPGRHLKQVSVRVPPGAILVDVFPSVVEVIIMDPNEGQQPQ